MPTSRTILVLSMAAVLAMAASGALAQEAPAKKDATAFEGENAGDVVNRPAPSGKTAPPTLPGIETLLQMVLWLAVIIVFIYVSVWLIRKYVPSARGVLGGGPLMIVKKMHVSAKQSIVLVKLGGRFVLVGVTANSMTPLSEITDAEEAKKLTEDFAAQQHGDSSMSFRSVFSRARGEQSDAAKPADGTDVREVSRELDEVRQKVSWWRRQTKS